MKRKTRALGLILSSFALALAACAPVRPTVEGSSPTTTSQNFQLFVEGGRGVMIGINDCIMGDSTPSERRGLPPDDGDWLNFNRVDVCLTNKGTFFAPEQTGGTTDPRQVEISDDGKTATIRNPKTGDECKEEITSEQTELTDSNWTLLVNVSETCEYQLPYKEGK
jgi:hypothetical protein